MNTLNPYVDKDGKERMLESVVCFADVLGFTDRIKKTYQKSDEAGLLAEFRNAIKSTYPFLQNKPYLQDKIEWFVGRDAWEFKAFSDHIVIGFPIENPDEDFPVRSSGEAELSQVFHMLSVFQLTMIQHGFFIRGGISIGKLYMDNEIVFGHAYLRAYETESKKALYPRVVLDSALREESPEKSYLRSRFGTSVESENSQEWRDPSAAGYVKLHLSSYYDRSWSSHCRHILEDGDKKLFLNYLNVIIFEHPHDESQNAVDLEALLEHKRQVESNLENSSGDAAIWNKYAWVARYHNYFCDEHSFIDDSYRIDASFLRPRKLC